MKSPATFHMCASRKAECDRLIDAGKFDTISDLVGFALRLYLVDSSRKTLPAYVLRNPPYVRVNVRVNDWAVDRIVESGTATKADMCDRAVEHLFHVLELLEKEGPGEE